MSQAQDLERQPFSVAVVIKLKALAKAISEFWEGYMQRPSGC